MKLDMKIVKNDKSKEISDKPLRCTARLVWRDAVLSDGTTCDAEMLDKLLKGVDIEKYAPPLCLQHDWDVRDVIGKMTDIKIADDALIAAFDVWDVEAQKKIAAGVWDNISLSYELPDCAILECSLVAVPAIPGARIEAEEKPAEEKPEAEEEKPPEEKPEAEEEKPPEEKPEAEEEIDITLKENACGGDDKEKRITENSKIKTDRIVQLEKQIKSLQQQCKELSDLLIQNDKKQKCENLQRQWVANGRTSPAVKDAEMRLLLTMDAKQLEAYKQIKDATPAAVIHGKRLSQPAALVKTREEEFSEGYKKWQEAQR